VAAWAGWTAVIAIGALVASISIVFAMVQYITQKGAYSLEQIKFMMSLAEDFSLYDRMYNEAWRTLRKYGDIPKEMGEQEWSNTASELEKCYQSVKFLFRIAKLAKSGLIESSLLCIFYHDEIVDHYTGTLQFLIKWCGTGVDLAANYNSYELGRMIKEVNELVIMLNAIHEKYGGEPDKFIIAGLERIERDFLSDLTRFDVASDNYIDNYITIEKDSGR